MSENIRSTAQTCTHGVMSNGLVVLDGGMIALAGCDGRPAATLARPDSTKNAAAEVARGTDPDDAQALARPIRSRTLECPRRKRHRHRSTQSRAQPPR